MNALFCYTNYAFHSLLEEWANENAFFRLVWQNYYENESAYADLKKKFSEVSSNVVVTGLPVTDLFLNRKNTRIDGKRQIKSVNGLFGHHIFPYLVMVV